MLRYNVQTYIKGCNVCLVLKIVKNKLYKDLQFLPGPTYRQKNLSIDFVISLQISINQQDKTYDLILIIVDKVKKIVQEKFFHANLNIPSLIKVIIDAVIQYHELPGLMISECGPVLTFRFQLSICYLIKIKRQLSTGFHLQTLGLIKKDNNMMIALL